MLLWNVFFIIKVFFLLKFKFFNIGKEFVGVEKYKENLFGVRCLFLIRYCEIEGFLNE